MTNKVTKIQKILQYIPYISAAIYITLLLPFYKNLYKVPDHSSYYYHSNDMVYNGFSSLFMYIQKIPNQILEFLCLASLAITVFIMTYVFIQLAKTTFAAIINILLVFSFAPFYYIAGKHIYEFPFIALFYSILLLLFLSPIALPKLKTKLNIQQLCICKKNIFYLLCGFILSWKVTAIFTVTGITILLYLNQYSSYKRVLLALYQEKLAILVYSLLGWSFGYFYLYIHPISLINNIAIYQGRPITAFFKNIFHTGTISLYFLNIFNQAKPWDFIALPSFWLGVINLPTFICLMIYVFRKKSRIYAWLALTMFLLLVFSFSFILNFSWHAFPTGLFLLSLFCFVICSQAYFSKKEKILLLIAVISQIIFTFLIYVPLQSNVVNAISDDAKYLQESNLNFLDEKTLITDPSLPVCITTNIKRYILVQHKGHPISVSGFIKNIFPTEFQYSIPKAKVYCNAKHNIIFLEMKKTAEALRKANMYHNYTCNSLNKETKRYKIYTCAKQ